MQPVLRRYWRMCSTKTRTQSEKREVWGTGSLRSSAEQQQMEASEHNKE